MKIKYTFSLFFLLFISNVFSQNNDLSVVIYESAINKLMKAIGPISGENEYHSMFVNCKYKWTAKDSKIKLVDNKAQFISNVKVEAGSLSYTDDIVGEFKVSYNPVTNKLELKLMTAVFEVYTKVLGEKIVIKRIDLKDYIKDPFLFDGPLYYQSATPFTMPDNTIKKIGAKIKKSNILVLATKIVMNADMEFSEIK